MSVLLKALALKFLAGRTIGGAFSLLLILLAPFAAVLKFIGLPVLLVVGVIGAPVFLLLAAVGLPGLLVVGVGVVMMLAIGLMLTLGLLALKIALPIILIVWFVRWLRRPKTAQPPVSPSPEPGLDSI
ncbi:MAG: hypothetical protein JWL61_4730 [Gemmatimonadetes bacterium]|jgi:hypothetical protein|nr:hypothetical protein [Gemmatimonadota bacterium]